MKCLICNSILEPFFIHNFITYKCYKCNEFYISSNNIDYFIFNYANNKVKCKSKLHKKIYFSMLEVNKKAHKYIENDIKCMNDCRDICYLY